MKNPTIAIVLMFAAVTTFALDITTRDGTVYQNVTVCRVEPDGITIQHSTGIEKIHARNLSDEDRTRFRLTPEAARAYLEQQRKAKEQVAEAAALAAKARTYYLRCLVSDDRGIICRDHGNFVMDSSGIHRDGHYTYYFIRNRSGMPDTDFHVYAAPKGRIKINDRFSAIELIPMKKPPNSER